MTIDKGQNGHHQLSIFLYLFSILLFIFVVLYLFSVLGQMWKKMEERSKNKAKLMKNGIFLKSQN